MVEKHKVKKDKKEVYKSTYYSGNVAYQEAPSYIPEPDRYPQKPISRPSNRVQKRTFTAFKYNFNLIFSVLIVFAGCLIIMVSYATVTQQRVTNQRLKDQLQKAQSENVAVEADLTNQLNLDFVANEAKQRLGMSEPQSYQVNYIDVPKQSYTVQHDVNEVEEKTNFSIQKLIDFFKRK